MSCIQRWAASLAVLAAALLAAACTSVPRIPAKGTFHGVAIDTTVDSEIARYYIEAHHRGAGADPARQAAIQALEKRHTGTLPTREDLAAISNEHSVDFATLFFADRLLQRDCDRQINEVFRSYVADPRRVRADPSRYLVLFVPGWDYVANGHRTGSDFAQPRRIARAFGLENHLVSLPPTGSVEENAAIVAREISKRAASGKRIVVAGASSAGPAIHVALARMVPKAELAAVKAWLNLGGILQGTPLIDDFQSWRRGWLLNVVGAFKGWDPAAVASMGTEAARKRFGSLRIEADLFILNYLGVPLSGQVSQFGSDKYPLLRSRGPNDGLTLLPDAIAPGSYTIVALGSDHFFGEDPLIERKTVALMAMILAIAESGRPACEAVRDPPRT